MKIELKNSIEDWRKVKKSAWKYPCLLDNISISIVMYNMQQSGKFQWQHTIEVFQIFHLCVKTG